MTLSKNQIEVLALALAHPHDWREMAPTTLWLTKHAVSRAATVLTERGLLKKSGVPALWLRDVAVLFVHRRHVAIERSRRGEKS